MIPKIIGIPELEHQQRIISFIIITLIERMSRVLMVPMFSYRTGA